MICCDKIIQDIASVFSAAVSLIITYFQLKKAYRSFVLNITLFDISIIFNDDKKPPYILMWSHPFGFNPDLHSCPPIPNVSICDYTYDRNNLHKVDAIIVHQFEVKDSKIRNFKYYPEQFWFWYNLEPYYNLKIDLKLMDNIFNFTISFRRDSDVYVPYGVLITLNKQQDKIEIPKKDKLVCWIVSNHKKTLKRNEIYNNMSQYIHIHKYGSGSLYAPPGSEKKIISECKFYLSFESSNQTDYITEKFWNPLAVGTVPIVYGPPKNNYLSVAKEHSFIHVEDYSKLSDLTDYIKYLGQNTTAYMEYFQWKKTHSVLKLDFITTAFCKVCHFLKNIPKNYTSIRNNIDQWFK